MPEPGTQETTALEKEVQEPKLLRFVIDEKAFAKEELAGLKKRADQVNRLADIVNLLSWWTREAISQQPNADLMRLRAQVKAWTGIKNKIESAIPIAALIDEVVSPDLPDEEAMQKLAQTLGVADWPKNIQEIPVSRAEQIYDLEDRLSIAGTIIHDIRSPMSTVYGYLEIIAMGEADPKYAEKVFLGLKKTAANVEYCLSLLENPYPKETISVNDFLNTLNANSHFGRIQVESPPNLLQDTKITWSKTWSDSLASNIMQNIAKAYKSAGALVWFPATTDLKIVEKNGQKMLQVSIEDQGTGFPDEIVANGFQPSVTIWKNAEGTGIGMYSQLRALRDHYRGDIIPENVFDESGKVTGARLNILFPLTS